MRLRSVLVLFSLLFVLLSCSLDGESSQTPSVSIATYPILQNGDTLGIYTTSRYDEILMDTIQVGDTVSLVLHMYSYSNNLTHFFLKQSSDSSTQIELAPVATLDSIFVAGSDYDKGDFVMATGFNRLLFPFKYVATKANLKTKLTIKVVSDAKFENMSPGANTASFNLLTPIKPKVIAETIE